MEQIVEYRRYAEMKLAYDAADKDGRKRIRATAMGALVEQITFALAEDEING